MKEEGTYLVGSAAFHGGDSRHGGAKKVIRRQKRFIDHVDPMVHKPPGPQRRRLPPTSEYMRLNPYKHQLVNDEKEP